MSYLGLNIEIPETMYKKIMKKDKVTKLESIIRKGQVTYRVHNHMAEFFYSDRPYEAESED